jgi:hypothetical protein
MLLNRPHGHSDTSDDGKDPRCQREEKKRASQSRYNKTRATRNVPPTLPVITEITAQPTVSKK